MSVADATPARRWGLGADSTGGLIGKIILLAVFTAIAVWLAIPLVAAQNYILLALVGSDDVGALRHLSAALAHPDQVPRAGDHLPDPVPDHPGRLHVRDGVHQLR